MDKTGFLKELEQYLAVLNESEQKDILDEYAQHIDMKMESGMSEQEAIGDFGNMEELAADILEAYHVNPMYSGKKKTTWKKEIPLLNQAKEGPKLTVKGLELVRQLGRKISGGVHWLGGQIVKPFRWMKETWLKWQKKRRDKKKEHNLQVISPAEGKKKMKVGEIPGKIVGGIGQMMIAMVHMLFWCIRWLWNICMVFVIVLAGGFMLMALFCTGTLVVLLAQGYPLIGFFIGCLGVVICTGGIAALALGLIRRKQEAIEHA